MFTDPCTAHRHMSIISLVENPRRLSPLPDGPNITPLPEITTGRWSISISDSHQVLIATRLSSLPYFPIFRSHYSLSLCPDTTVISITTSLSVRWTMMSGLICDFKHGTMGSIDVVYSLRCSFLHTSCTTLLCLAQRTSWVLAQLWRMRGVLREAQPFLDCPSDHDVHSLQSVPVCMPQN